MYICIYIKTLRSRGSLIWEGDSCVDGYGYKTGLLTGSVLNIAGRGASSLLSVAYPALIRLPIDSGREADKFPLD